MSKAAAPSQQTRGQHAGLESTCGDMGLLSPREDAHSLVVLVQRKMSLPNWYKGTFGLTGPEAWLIQGTENMMDHEELKPLGQLPAAPHR